MSYAVALVTDDDRTRAREHAGAPGAHHGSAVRPPSGDRRTGRCLASARTIGDGRGPV